MKNTFELPVNETRGMRLSFAIAWPISAPPQKEVKIAPGKLFFSRTPATIFVIAIVIKGVVGAPFLRFCHVVRETSKGKLIKRKQKIEYSLNIQHCYMSIAM